ncbi:protein of unknown function [Methylorubrum extorquens DM4]|uniref:Uncharacterized protein n=1 Tax=Methylorubrum extorquens (strain DSM 6343 / CIP 106787 / DM4) TaxID=661410 RepID=C7CGS1_METED|nr:protein of unknown function [Methylorubrum extorquens DM4]
MLARARPRLRPSRRPASGRLAGVSSTVQKNARFAIVSDPETDRGQALPKHSRCCSTRISLLMAEMTQPNCKLVVLT